MRFSFAFRPQGPGHGRSRASFRPGRRRTPRSTPARTCSPAARSRSGRRSRAAIRRARRRRRARPPRRRGGGGRPSSGRSCPSDCASRRPIVRVVADQVPDRFAALALDLADPVPAERAEQLAVEGQAALDGGDDQVDVMDAAEPHRIQRHFDAAAVSSYHAAPCISSTTTSSRAGCARSRRATSASSASISSRGTGASARTSSYEAGRVVGRSSTRSGSSCACRSSSAARSTSSCSRASGRCRASTISGSRSTRTSSSARSRAPTRRELRVQEHGGRRTFVSTNAGYRLELHPPRDWIDELLEGGDRLRLSELHLKADDPERRPRRSRELLELRAAAARTSRSATRSCASCRAARRAGRSCTPSCSCDALDAVARPSQRSRARPGSGSTASRRRGSRRSAMRSRCSSRRRCCA